MNSKIFVPLSLSETILFNFLLLILDKIIYNIFIYLSFEKASMATALQPASRPLQLWPSLPTPCVGGEVRDREDTNAELSI